jgi:hypothetical protein
LPSFRILCTYKSALFLVLSVSCCPAFLLLPLIDSLTVEDDTTLSLRVSGAKEY